jgi:predicted CXXCH cytochrome family protein
MMACFAAVLVLASASGAMSGENPGTGIQNTAHDLGRGGGILGGMADAGLEERLCFYCHTPRHATTMSETTAEDVNRYPIWSQAAVTITSFETYTQGGGIIGQPGSVSRICLSCHDGLVATSVYGYVRPSAIWNVSRGQTAADEILLRRHVGDPSRHHPIGFDYHDIVAKDDEINPATSDLLGVNAYGMTIGDLLWSGRIECSSCHDVHNTKNEGRKFTWIEDSGSNLCFTCHKK